MVNFVNDNFIPARVHVKDDSALFQRYGEKYNAQWTPTILELDPQGVERYRIEGFLPVDDFLAELELGLGKLAFEHKQWGEAERHFRTVSREHPDSGVAAEACYWEGVSEYKATDRAEPLKETARVLSEKYPESPWTKKASVWKS